jgi:hypothetical protein
VKVVERAHVTAAGYRVMAAVTAPVLNRFTWRSSSCEVRFRNVEREWSPWQLYAALSPWQLEVGDGEKTVEVEYRDASGLVIAACDSIGLDTVPPVSSAPFTAHARRSATATLSYLVTDPLPCCGRADVRIKDQDTHATRPAHEHAARGEFRLSVDAAHVSLLRAGH